MKRIVIGKTGLEVNRFGFGGIPIQRVEEDQAVKTILHAVEKGVDFIDTSRAYTTSERRIGIALQQTDKKVILASKSHCRTSEGIDYHQVISSGGALEGLIQSKEKGLIGHIGLTSHSLDLMDRVLDDGLFETIMVCFSFLEPEAQEKIIPKAINKNVGVIAMKPFSGGIIENSRLALKYVLSQQGTVVIAGVEHEDLFDENWEIFQGSFELDDAERNEIEEIRKAREKNFCRRCDYCQPCTEDIPIQFILGVRSIVKRMGTDALRQGQFFEAVSKARKCSECGECEKRCPYQLPIPDLIKENLLWIDEQLKSL
jgi:predicted aldo/keto reductase-like oxidoreductase